MEVHLKKCKHGLHPEMCAFCKGVVTKKNQTKDYGILREGDFRDLENEDNEEKELVKELPGIFLIESDDSIETVDLDEPLTGKT